MVKNRCQIERVSLHKSFFQVNAIGVGAKGNRFSSDNRRRILGREISVDP